MYKKKIWKLLIYILFIAAFISIIIIIPKSNEEIPEHKILIIFAEALPYYIVNPNLDQFPAIKELCDQGMCTSLKPSAPTFTTMQNYVLDTGLNPNDAAFAYNFVIEVKLC